MNQLTNVTPAQPPAEQTRQEHELLARYRNALERTATGLYSISDQRAPAGDDRRALEQRLAVLQASDGRSQAAAIAARVARLFLRFPSSRLKDSESEATIAAYAFDLAAYPLWAIDQAIIEAIQKGGSFVPSSPELRMACERMVSRVRLEAAGIRAVLNAEVYHEPSPEERRRVAEAFDELVADLKLRTDYDRPPQARPLTRIEAQEWLDRYQEEQPPLPKLSPAARRASGLPEQGEEAA